MVKVLYGFATGITNIKILSTGSTKYAVVMLYYRTHATIKEILLV